MNPEMLNIQLSVDEINIILGALGARPYEEVAGLVNSVMGQANAGLDAKHKAESMEKETPQPKHAKEEKDRNETRYFLSYRVLFFDFSLTKFISYQLINMRDECMEARF